MDKRDYFAAAAIQGILANQAIIVNEDVKAHKDAMVKDAYAIADHMIKYSNYELTN